MLVSSCSNGREREERYMGTCLLSILQKELLPNPREMTLILVCMDEVSLNVEDTGDAWTNYWSGHLFPAPYYNVQTMVAGSMKLMMLLTNSILLHAFYMVVSIGF